MPAEAVFMERVGGEPLDVNKTMAEHGWQSGQTIDIESCPADLDYAEGAGAAPEALKSKRNLLPSAEPKEKRAKVQLDESAPTSCQHPLCTRTGSFAELDPNRPKGYQHFTDDLRVCSSCRRKPLEAAASEADVPVEAKPPKAQTEAKLARSPKPISTTKEAQVVAADSLTAADSLRWQLIAKQNVSKMLFSPTSRHTFLMNEKDVDADAFMCIGQLNADDPSLKHHQKYRFKLIYDGQTTLEWLQSSWPTSRNIEGFEAISPQDIGPSSVSRANRFAGLGASSSENSVFDGSGALNKFWWNSVGTAKMHSGGIPGWNKQIQSTMQLFIARQVEPCKKAEVPASSSSESKAQEEQASEKDKDAIAQEEAPGLEDGDPPLAACQEDADKPKVASTPAECPEVVAADAAMQDKESVPKEGALGDDDALEFDQDNPKKVGTSAWSRYEGYKLAKSMREALSLGAARGDIASDLKRGICRRL